jgi:CheY-like chemotaxis protein
MGLSDARGSTGAASLAPEIYVVDDSADLAEMLEVFLESAGYSTRVFHEPSQALEALTAAPAKPRLLVTDFEMPGMNGMELVQRCRALHPDLKVISASGHVLETADEDYPSHPDRVLPKPYSTRQLLGMVRSVLGE